MRDIDYGIWRRLILGNMISIHLPIKHSALQLCLITMKSLYGNWQKRHRDLGGTACSTAGRDILG